jgi:hypothetical protein
LWQRHLPAKEKQPAVTLLRLLFSLTISLLAGYMLVNSLLKDLLNGGPWTILKICLGSGIGLGLGSLSYFLWRLGVGPTKAGFFGFELAALLGLLVYQRKIKRKYTHSDKKPPARLVSNGWGLVVRLSFGMAVLGAGLSFGLETLKSPHGGWDAWAIWNREARFLYRENDQWRNAFSPLLSHADYPLLIATAVARSWSYAGVETPFGPASIAFLFSFGTIGLLVTSVSCLRGRFLGYVAGLGLLSASAFVLAAPEQYADIPLGFYILATIILLHFYEQQDGEHKHWLALAGMTAGLATWTKNEGWLFLLSLLLARLLAVSWSKKHVMDKPKYARAWESAAQPGNALPAQVNPSLWEEIKPFAAGLLPLLAIVLLFKAALAPANDLASGQGAGMLQQLVDASRYVQIGKAFLIQSINLGSLDATPLVILLALALLFGIRPPEWNKPAGSTALLVLSGMLAGYFIVYLITPNDLNWQLSTSLSRLYLQLWPLAVFILVTSIAAPGLTTGAIHASDETKPGS